MSCDLLALATKGVAGLQPYSGGKPIEELQRELGLDEIIKLASNENPLGPSQKVLDAIASTTDLARYPDGNGFSLKKALSDKHNIPPDCITLGNGSNDVLEMIARAFVTTEHQVIYAQHSFAVYPIVTQAVGAEHVVVPANEWGHDLNAMLAAITDKTKLIFVANPNNPTGTWLNKLDLRNFVENVPEHIIVLIDEAYFEYAITEENYPDSSLWLNEFPNLIVTRTFSKAYGLAGLRIGYALSHPDVANLLNRVRQPFNNNSLALAAAETALEDDAYIKQSVETNFAGMKQLMLAFDDMGLEFIPSKGNFICVDFEQPADAIYQSLLESGVIVRPVANYGMPNHLRVSIGTEQENSRFINELGKILSK
ncbi:MAG: histidinol-phosphate transaminase [Gammaproteobacteria bacterium]|jgi:histidinol-phosphate aminotransferase